MTTRITGLTISGSEIKIDYSKKEKNKPLFGWWYYIYGLVQGNTNIKGRLQLDGDKEIYYPINNDKSGLNYCTTGLESIKSFDTYISYINKDISTKYYNTETPINNTDFYLGTGIYDPDYNNLTSQMCNKIIKSGENTIVYSKAIECKQPIANQCLYHWYGTSQNIKPNTSKLDNNVINYGGWGNCGSYDMSNGSKCPGFSQSKGYDHTVNFVNNNNLCSNLEGSGGPMVVWDINKINNNLPTIGKMYNTTPGYVSIDIEGIYPSYNTKTKSDVDMFTKAFIKRVNTFKTNQNAQKVILTLPGFGIAPKNGGMGWFTQDVANAVDYVCLMYYSQINDTDTPGGCTDGDGYNGPQNVEASLSKDTPFLTSDEISNILNQSKNKFKIDTQGEEDKAYDELTYKDKYVKLKSYTQSNPSISFGWGHFLRPDQIILGYSLSNSTTKSPNKAYFSEGIIKNAHGGLSVWARKGGAYNTQDHKCPFKSECAGKENTDFSDKKTCNECGFHWGTNYKTCSCFKWPPNTPC